MTDTPPLDLDSTGDRKAQESDDSIEVTNKPPLGDQEETTARPSEIKLTPEEWQKLDERLASAEEALERISNAQHFEVIKNDVECLARFRALKEQGDKAREHFAKWGKE